jgi:hypothetical protein
MSWSEKVDHSIAERDSRLQLLHRLADANPVEFQRVAQFVPFPSLYDVPFAIGTTFSQNPLQLQFFATRSQTDLDRMKEEFGSGMFPSSSVLGSWKLFEKIRLEWSSWFLGTIIGNVSFVVGLLIFACVGVTLQKMRTQKVDTLIQLQIYKFFRVQKEEDENSAENDDDDSTAQFQIESNALFPISFRDFAARSGFVYFVLLFFIGWIYPPTLSAGIMLLAKDPNDSYSHARTAGIVVVILLPILGLGFIFWCCFRRVGAKAFFSVVAGSVGVSNSEDDEDGGDLFDDPILSQHLEFKIIRNNENNDDGDNVVDKGKETKSKKKKVSIQEMPNSKNIIAKQQHSTSKFCRFEYWFGCRGEFFFKTENLTAYLREKMKRFRSTMIVESAQKNREKLNHLKKISQNHDFFEAFFSLDFENDDSDEDEDDEEEQFFRQGRRSSSSSPAIRKRNEILLQQQKQRFKFVELRESRLEYFTLLLADIQCLLPFIESYQNMKKDVSCKIIIFLDFFSQIVLLPLVEVLSLLFFSSSSSSSATNSRRSTPPFSLTPNENVPASSYLALSIVALSTIQSLFFMPYSSSRVIHAVIALCGLVHVGVCVLSIFVFNATRAEFKTDEEYYDSVAHLGNTVGGSLLLLVDVLIAFFVVIEVVFKGILPYIKERSEFNEKFDKMKQRERERISELTRRKQNVSGRRKVNKYFHGESDDDEDPEENLQKIIHRNEENRKAKTEIRRSRSASMDNGRISVRSPSVSSSFRNRNFQHDDDDYDEKDFERYFEQEHQQQETTSDYRCDYPPEYLELKNRDLEYFVPAEHRREKARDFWREFPRVKQEMQNRRTREQQIDEEEARKQNSSSSRSPSNFNFYRSEEDNRNEKLFRPKSRAEQQHQHYFDSQEMKPRQRHRTYPKTPRQKFYEWIEQEHESSCPESEDEDYKRFQML